MRKDSQQVISEQVERMMRRAQHKLDYFNNRITRSRFVDLPSQRLVKTAEQQARWFADELASLSLELEQVEKQFVSQLEIRETVEKDIRILYPWLIQPGNRDALRLEDVLSPSDWYARIQRWILEPDYYPFSIERYDGTVVGFMLVRRVGRGWDDVSARLDIHLVGPRWRSLGYGTEALRRYVEHLQEDIGLQEIRLTVDCENISAIRCFEKTGFHATAMHVETEREVFQMEILPHFGVHDASLETGAEVTDAEDIPLRSTVIRTQLEAAREQLGQ